MFIKYIFLITLVSVSLFGCGGSSTNTPTNASNDNSEVDTETTTPNNGITNSDSRPAEIELPLQENFDGEFQLHSNSGTIVSASVINITQLSQFSVDGAVDLIKSDDGFNIFCPNNNGYCLDLDGTDATDQQAGKITSGNIPFTEGNYLLSFTIGGNQRVTQSDRLTISLEPYLPEFEIALENDDEFSTKTYSFSVNNIGSANLVFELLGEPDNFGPILDNILLQREQNTPLECIAPIDQQAIATTELDGIVSPPRVFAGNTVPVDITKQISNPSNVYIEITKPNADIGDRETNFAYLNTDDLVLNAPPVPGVYNIRIIDGNNIIGLKEFTVIEPIIDSMQSEVAGTVMDICWAGPTWNKQMYLEITVPGADIGDRVTNFVYLDDDQGSETVQLNVPPVPGTYDLRLVFRPSDTIIVKKTITVEPPTITFNSSTVAGTEIDIDWTGPTWNKQMYLEITVPGADIGDRVTNFVYLDDDQGMETVQLNVPPVPGTYDLRLVSRPSDTIIVKKTITVEPPTITFNSPAVAGTEIDIDWTGPTWNKQMYLEITVPGADIGDRVTNFVYLDDDQGMETVQLNVPPAPGTYDLRLVSRPSNTIIVKKTLVVTAN